MRWFVLLVTVGSLAVLSGCGGGGSRSAANTSNILVFDEYDGTDDEIYRLNIQTGQVTQLTNNAVGDSRAAINRAGTKIAFIRQGNIWVMNVDGTGVTQLTTTGNEGPPSWSPDGSKLVFSSDRANQKDLFVINADGTGETQLTNSQFSRTDPSFRPDGAKIVFTGSNNYDIWTINPDGSGAAVLHVGPNQQQLPVYNPAGNRIAYVQDTTSNFELHVINSDGTNPTVLDAGDCWSPSWGQDGRLVYIRYTGTAAEIRRMNADLTSSTLLLTRSMQLDGVSVP